mmetsp:Transcript_25707/g.29581  ORF Transcript_25707/g.29581 Transcript_25707/m.29581 type:complete len:211 (-) Transcript_25707:211-843(-)
MGLMLLPSETLICRMLSKYCSRHWTCLLLNTASLGHASLMSCSCKFTQPFTFRLLSLFHCFSVFITSVFFVIGLFPMSRSFSFGQTRLTASSLFSFSLSSVSRDTPAFKLKSVSLLWERDNFSNIAILLMSGTSLISFFDRTSVFSSVNLLSGFAVLILLPDAISDFNDNNELKCSSEVISLFEMFKVTNLTSKYTSFGISEITLFDIFR